VRNLIAFAPRKYNVSIIEAMALTGVFDPANLASEAALTAAAERLQLGDAEAEWSARRTDDGGVALERLWRGVTDAHLIEPKFLESAEARKLHSIVAEEAESYAVAGRLLRSTAVEEASDDDDETDADAPDFADDDAITRPTELLDAVMTEGRKGLKISRYKGLGEMNAEQLWETTLDPDHRILLQVKVEDADVTDEIFTRLMGDVVEPRREFIQDNALNVANLDV